MNFYKKNKIKAYGIYSLESDLADNIYDYLEKYNPDILVMTGHPVCCCTQKIKNVKCS